MCLHIQLRGMKRRTARFVCLIALAESGALLATFRGVVDRSFTVAARN